MGGQRFAMLGGGIWTLFRFAVIALLVLRTAPTDPVFHVNLLWVGAPSLIVVALFAGTAFVPEALRYYLPMLRIGTMLAAIADTAVVLTSSFVPAAQRVGPNADPVGRLIFVIVHGVLAVDLLILAALVSYRPMTPNRDERRDTRPDYESSTVEEE